MLVLTNASNMHTLGTHNEKYDRLIQCYSMMKSQDIPYYYINSCSGGLASEYLTKSVLECSEDDYYCPSCFKDENEYCGDCEEVPVKMITADTYMTPYTIDTIRGSIGCISYAASRLRIEKYIYMLIRPPGHHADEDPSGFCFINTAHVAVKELRKNGFRRVGILDWDFHHANGTETAVSDDRDVFLCSIHGYGDYVYPGTGDTSNNSRNLLNIPIDLDEIPKHTVTTDMYIEKLINEILPFFEGKIDVLYVSNGLDAHKDDSLAGMNIGTDFYVKASRILTSLGVPMLYGLEGGYTGSVIAEVTFGIYNMFKEFEILSQSY